MRIEQLLALFYSGNLCHVFVLTQFVADTFGVAAHPYRDRTAALATRHGKLPLIAPAMTEFLGLAVVSIEADTDSLGTFTGEVARVGNQWETAVAKARLGMAESGLSLGLANEGSFAPYDPAPFVITETELVVLVDDTLGIVIGEIETAFSPPTTSFETEPGTIDLPALERAGFPEHGVIVRPADGWDPIVKGIHDIAELHRAVARCAAASPIGLARIESDLSAHHHPFRRDVIASAAQRLARRLAMICPTCDAPGWGVTAREPGAPCALCRQPTWTTLAERWGCGACDNELRLEVGEWADPAQCTVCNP